MATGEDLPGSPSPSPTRSSPNPTESRAVSSRFLAGDPIYRTRSSSSCSSSLCRGRREGEGLMNHPHDPEDRAQREAISMGCAGSQEQRRRRSLFFSPSPDLSLIWGGFLAHPHRLCSNRIIFLRCCVISIIQNLCVSILLLFFDRTGLGFLIPSFMLSLLLLALVLLLHYRFRGTVKVSTLAIMGGPCLWDGTLSLNDFNASSADLAKRWKVINPTLPQWKWIPCQRTGVSCNTEGYLALENMYQLSASEELIDEENYSAEEEPFDNATLVQSYNDDMHVYDFHIVYSFSYQVPVLYFRGYRCDGHPLHLCDIEKDLPPYSSKIRDESKWTFMTQEEHPYLCRPWYTLHPCGTSDWMKLLLGSDLASENPDMMHYLSAWLSVVGQAVGLRIPLELHNKSI